MKTPTALTSSSYQLLIVILLVTLTKIRQSDSFTTHPTTFTTTRQLSSIPSSLLNVRKCVTDTNESPPSQTQKERPAQQQQQQQQQQKQPQQNPIVENRRSAILRRPLRIFLFLAASSSSPLSPFAPPRPALAASRRWESEPPRPSPPIKPSQEYNNNKVKTELDIIQEASTALQSLLDNWEKATIDCAYADVPRELLETKNKEQLLEKASTYALFDKGAVAVSCRRTNRLVRDYIGATGKGPLVGLEKRMLSRGKGGVVDFVDPDMLDDYYSEVESFSRAISRASSLSYAAGMADLNSVNNFAKDEDPNAIAPTSTATITTTTPTSTVTNTTATPTVQTPEDSNLEQARTAVVDAKGNIDRILKFLNGGLAVAK